MVRIFNNKKINILFYQGIRYDMPQDYPKSILPEYFLEVFVAEQSIP
jgi:hypothetical protein